MKITNFLANRATVNIFRNALQGIYFKKTVETVSTFFCLL